MYIVLSKIRQNKNSISQAEIICMSSHRRSFDDCAQNAPAAAKTEAGLYHRSSRITSRPPEEGSNVVSSYTIWEEQLMPLCARARARRRTFCVAREASGCRAASALTPALLFVCFGAGSLPEPASLLPNSPVPRFNALSEVRYRCWQTQTTSFDAAPLIGANELSSRAYFQPNYIVVLFSLLFVFLFSVEVACKSNTFVATV